MQVERRQANSSSSPELITAEEYTPGSDDPDALKERDSPPIVQFPITPRALQVLIEKITEDQKRSKVYSFLAHPLLLVLIGSLAGATITYLYTIKQQEVT